MTPRRCIRFVTPGRSLVDTRPVNGDVIVMIISWYFGCILDKDGTEGSSGCDEQTLLPLRKFYAACDHFTESMSAGDEGFVDDKAGIQSVADADLAIFLARQVHDRLVDFTSSLKSSTAL